ncbi:hypothetical protein K3A88_25595, partial [Streptomyces geysiriensis]|nr:hypothetical protein [Streptomyces geysiriensis]
TPRRIPAPNPPPDPARGPAPPGGGRVPAHAQGAHTAEPALAHLHGLERALTELAAPLRAPSGSPLAGA